MKLIIPDANECVFNVSAKDCATPPSPSIDLIYRIKSAIEGECEGLAITDAQASAILSYVLPSPSSAEVVKLPPLQKATAWMVPISGVHEYYATKRAAVRERAEYEQSMGTDADHVEPEELFTAEQVRQAQREAIAADRARRIEITKALHKAGAPTCRDDGQIMSAVEKIEWFAARRAPVAEREDAERFRRAIALDDNAEALYAAVFTSAGDGEEIRAAFDAATLQSPSQAKDQR